MFADFSEFRRISVILTGVNAKDCYISDKCEKSLVGSAAGFQAKFAGIDRATSSKRPTARTGPSSFFAQPAAAIASTLAADRKVCVASKAALFAEMANPTTRTDFHRRAARPSPRTSGIGWKGAALKRIPRVHHRRTSPAHITGAHHRRTSPAQITGAHHRRTSPAPITFAHWDITQRWSSPAAARFRRGISRLVAASAAPTGHPSPSVPVQMPHPLDGRLAGLVPHALPSFACRTTGRVAALAALGATCQLLVRLAWIPGSPPRISRSTSRALARPKSASNRSAALCGKQHTDAALGSPSLILSSYLGFSASRMRSSSTVSTQVDLGMTSIPKRGTRSSTG